MLRGPSSVRDGPAGPACWLDDRLRRRPGLHEHDGFDPPDRPGMTASSAGAPGRKMSSRHALRLRCMGAAAFLAALPLPAIEAPSAEPFAAAAWRAAFVRPQAIPTP